MAKKVTGFLKLQVPAGAANPSPPIGPALGQRGLNIMEFCKAFNAQTQKMEKNTPIPVVITTYQDRSFTFELKTPPVSFFLKKAAKLESGSKTPGRDIVGSVTKAQINEIAKEKMKDFALSQADEEFYEKLEAANRSLELAIGLRKENVHSRRLDTFLLKLIADGGNWNYVRALVGKYGAVPASVMPDDYAAAHTDELVGLLSARLRKAVLEVRQPKFDSAEAADLQEWKMATLKDVYKILVLCLGQPPTSFEWRYENKDGKITPLEKYTPQSFYKKFLDPDLDRYVSLANYPGQPMNTHLEWAWERILADQPNFEAVNISADEMAEMAAKSILADQPVWFAANSGAEGDKKKGLWLQDIEDQQDLFGIDFSMSKADTLAYDNGKPDHAMVITGVDIRDGKPVKWKVENSWGEKAGDKGWFTIDSRWFSRHVFQVIIDRKFVPEKILAVSKQKTILLPPWDPFTDWNQGK